jgi:hypothetical protein
VPGDRLDLRALNRATLDRQLLLRRHELPPLAAVDHLVGMQAQTPNAPYVGLWSRLAGFSPEALAALVTDRRVVRAPLMRSTLHLVTADDACALRPVVQSVCERHHRTASPFGRQIDPADVADIVAAGRELLAEHPRTRAELGPLLAARWPALDQDALSYTVTYLAALVQVTPRGVWGATGPSAWTTTEAWLGRDVGTDPTPDGTVLRYLGAFGPASVQDVQQWSGLTRLREVLDRLRPGLRTFRDDDGRELFDLPGAPRPDPDTPAPPRFLPEYDNVQFSHADRRRVLPEGRRPPLYGGNGGVLGTVLVDGWVVGTWRLDSGPGGAAVTVEPWAALTPGDRDAVAEEGRGLAAFSDPDASFHDVRFAPPE